MPYTQGYCLVSMETTRLLSYLAIHYERTFVDGEGWMEGVKESERERECAQEKTNERGNLF